MCSSCEDVQIEAEELRQGGSAAMLEAAFDFLVVLGLFKCVELDVVSREMYL